MALKLHREQFKDVMEIVTIPSLQSLEIFVHFTVGANFKMNEM